MVGSPHTQFLIVRSDSTFAHRVSIDLLAPADGSPHDVRFSPIFPAYLSPGVQPATVPEEIRSLGFAFSSRPYVALGKIRPGLSEDERHRTYFSQGLASLVFINFSREDFEDLIQKSSAVASEFWPLEGGGLDERAIVCSVVDAENMSESCPQIKMEHPEIDVYVRQINASVSTLWYFCGIYHSEERSTVKRVADLVKRLVERYGQGIKHPVDLNGSRLANAVVSALVEISAALSYAVTQGCTGATPILRNRSPFPHHSLLGVGGAVRAITKFTRYLESAFERRNAASVIRRRYGTHNLTVPTRISTYEPDPSYHLVDSVDEEFDQGGDFRETEHVPLICHFSLRHGFKESKFSVTAASEALTAEVSPQWTMMTLSHEIMHNRVREIFQELFRQTETDGPQRIVTQQQFEEFRRWKEHGNSEIQTQVTSALRNCVLDFCCGVDRVRDVRSERRSDEEKMITVEDVRSSFRRNSLLAVEIFVHFHDYYFAYASQPKMYLMSLWASWVRVASPFARTREYLARSLATVACGTGLKPSQAYDHAVSQLEDALDSLEGYGYGSPLFTELRKLADREKHEKSFIDFKLQYFLIDQVRRFFASREISNAIDRIEDDPFSGGSTSSEEYAGTIFVRGQPGQFVSPIRYSLASLCRSLKGELEIDDGHWLTAWNALVISSQDTSL